MTRDGTDVSPSSHVRSSDASPRRSRNDLSRLALLAIGVSLLLVSAALAPAAVAQEEDGPAPVPAAYYGDVTINGDPAPVGTEITAVVNGEERGSIVVSEAGSYGGPNALDEKLVVEDASPGEEVTFVVRGVAADETVSWESGDVRQVDLAFEGVPEPSESDSSDGTGASAGGSGGGGAPAAGTGSTTPADDGTPEDDGATTDAPADDSASGSAEPEVVSESTANISADAEDDRATATFEENTSVSEVAFDASSTSGQVSVTDLSTAPSETGDPPGASVSVSEIEVPDGAEEQSATLRFSLSNERLQEADATADDLRVNRFSDGTWQSLETRVVEETTDGVTLEADTPGFSYFSVSAVGEPDAQLTLSPERAAPGSEVTLDGSASSDPYGEIESYQWVVDGDELSGETTTVSIEDPGEYAVELTVTNDAGETDTATETLVVSSAGSDDSQQSDDESTAALDGDGTDTAAEGAVERETFGGLPSTWLLGATLALVALGVVGVFVYRRGDSTGPRL